jgi:N-acyl-D-glutamate deacylase
MKKIAQLLLAGILVVSLTQSCQSPEKGDSKETKSTYQSMPASTDFDVVILNGRVMDPETNFDGIRNVGIKDGIIGLITEKDIKGKETIDATGKIVSPGFIDLHHHGLNIGDYRLQTVQGVTTALELESGILPISDFYKGQAAKNLPINYGASAAWTFGRIACFTGHEPEADLKYFQDAQGRTDWKDELATPEQLKKILAEIEQGLKEGALGIGVNAGYAPGNGHFEYYNVAKLAKKYGVGTYTHTRFAKSTERNSAFEAFQELIANAAVTGINMHICHINSMSQKDIHNGLELFENAQANGTTVTAGTYPWGAASTVAKAAVFTGPTWKEDLQTDYNAFQYGKKRLTKAEFDDLQANAPGTLIIWHFLDANKPEELALIDASVIHPRTIIESDAVPSYKMTDSGLVPYEGDAWPLSDDLVNHPRSSASFSKILQDYVRDRQLMDLQTAIKKMSLMPAQTIEGFVPQMKKKGRLQEGMDADINVFDLNDIKVNADYVYPVRPSEGMFYVLVAGTPVVENGKLLLDAAPGQPIRRALQN